ncbi:MAG TPA: ATP-binding protein [Candidatus Xenobia bacterium]|jgi:DNA replication protein DnaC
MTWLKETIYRKPPQQLFGPPSYPDARLRSWKVYTPEFVNAVDCETKWVRPDKRVRLTQEQADRFEDAANVCPLCSGSGNLRFKVRGESTGIELSKSERCECTTAKLFWLRWRKVSPRYRAARLSTVEPSILVDMPMAKQAAVIELVKRNADRSMILTGDAKTGKSHLMMCVYRHAVAERASTWNGVAHFGVWRVNASVWLEEQVRESTSNDDDLYVPDLTEKRIQRVADAKYKPRLFLEEIDKFKPSDFKLIRLFEIVNAVYEAGGQVVATTNAPVDELAASWGPRYGETILRRIGEEPDGMTMKFSSS